MAWRLTGGGGLSGVLTTGPAKNEALAVLGVAAALPGPTTVAPLPRISDVAVMLDVIEAAGAGVTFEGSGATISDVGLGRIRADVSPARKIRASYYVAPTVAARDGVVRFPLPGGCDVGDRPMHLHFAVAEAFGYSVNADSGGYEFKRVSAPASVEVDLAIPSRGATVAALIHTIATRTRLVLGNPNRSPEVLAALAAAANETGLVGHLDGEYLVIDGRGLNLEETFARVGPDRAEFATLLGIAALASRDVKVAYPGEREGVQCLLDRLEVAGIAIETTDTLFVPEMTTEPDFNMVASLEPDAIDADWLPPFAAVAALVPGGTGVFLDTMNPGRHANLARELRRLGLVATEEGGRLRVRGVTPPKVPVREATAADLRTGAALVVAGLFLEGVTTIWESHQLDRGYENFASRLRGVGARVEVGPD